MASSVQAVRMGYGFAWLPGEYIRDDLAAGILKPLPLRGSGERVVPLYLILADPEFAGPGVRRLAEIIRETVAAQCARRAERP
jgi:DNA-binding transcriptional LysR family regulator